MEPRDREQDENRTGPDRLDHDRLDQWLDTALPEYGSAEPRMGLEGRVLANLAAERARSRGQRWWVWGAAAALACLGTVVRVGVMNHRPATGNIAGSVASGGLKPGAVNGQADVKRPVIGATRRRVRPRAAAIEAAKEPRLRQFPSPRGLSEQEQLLVRYVTESPDEAVLVAKEQAERQKELEELIGNESSKADSDQIER